MMICHKYSDEFIYILTTSRPYRCLLGGLLSYFRGLLGSREMRILILGLDGAGKTTILYRLQVGEVVTTIPTIGFNVEQVTYKNLKFQVWDLGKLVKLKLTILINFSRFQVVRHRFGRTGDATIVTQMQLFMSLTRRIRIE